MTNSQAPALIIHARASSSRLPKKVLLTLQGREMLLHQIDRMRLCRNTGPLLVATSDQPDDDAVAALCEREAVTCFRGPLDDVAQRMLMAAASVDAQAFVRLSGDSPFLDPRLVDTIVDIFHASYCDLATNVQLRTFPKGQSVEVVSVAALHRAYADMPKEDREHVTSYFYSHDKQYKIANLTSGENYGAVQLSVDTPQDFAMAQQLFAALASPLGSLDWKTITKLRMEQSHDD